MNDTPRTDAILMECPSHLQEVALANLALDLELELAHSLANQLTAQAEIERLKELLNRAINEIEKTPFNNPKLTAFTAHRLANRYREKMTNTSTNTQNTKGNDK